MKFDVQKYINTNRFIVRAILNSIHDNEEVIESIKEDAELESKVIDIEMKINGYDVDPVAFFDHLEDCYRSSIQDEAKRRFNEYIKEHEFEITEDLRKIREKTKVLANKIDWDGNIKTEDDDKTK